MAQKTFKTKAELNIFIDPENDYTNVIVENNNIITKI